MKTCKHCKREITSVTVTGSYDVDRYAETGDLIPAEDDNEEYVFCPNCDKELEPEDLR
jgi:hypothetical protein